VTPFDRYYYEAACDLAVRAIRSAACPWGYDVSDPIGCAVTKAQHAMREARRLELYPSTAQLDAELRRAA
jgi:hypothetical protein